MKSKPNTNSKEENTPDHIQIPCIHQITAVKPLNSEEDLTYNRITPQKLPTQKTHLVTAQNHIKIHHDRKSAGHPKAIAPYLRRTRT